MNANSTAGDEIALQEGMIRFRPQLLPTLWFLPGLILLTGLGVWQIERLHWKLDLIAKVEKRFNAPPASFGDVWPPGDVLTDDPLELAEYGRVRLHGRFLNDKEAYFFTLSRDGVPGYHVITPFLVRDFWSSVQCSACVTPNNRTSGAETPILVDRGFVTLELRDPGKRASGQTDGETDLIGVIRRSEPPGLFTPSANVQTRVWYTRDIRAIAAISGFEAADVGPIAPTNFFVEADATPNPGGWPLGGQTRVEFPNDHLQYAITWFGLALALTGVYLVYHVRQGRLGFG